jgi:hypothetical protein
MPADTGRSSGVGEPEARPPRRSAPEIVRDLERERAGLIEAVGRLKAEARATKARLLSPRTLGIAGGVVVLLVILRRWWKRR